MNNEGIVSKVYALLIIGATSLRRARLLVMSPLPPSTSRHFALLAGWEGVIFCVGNWNVSGRGGNR